MKMTNYRFLTILAPLIGLYQHQKKKKKKKKKKSNTHPYLAPHFQIMILDEND